MAADQREMVAEPEVALATKPGRQKPVVAGPSPVGRMMVLAQVRIDPTAALLVVAVGHTGKAYENHCR